MITLNNPIHPVIPAQNLTGGTTRTKLFIVIDDRFDLKYNIWRVIGNIMVPIRNQIRVRYRNLIRETAIEVHRRNK